MAIANILSLKPKYLIFDEPTTMLDSEGKEKVYKIIEKLKTQGYTIIYITNAVDEILFTDRIIILSEGKISNNFKKIEILKKINSFKQNNINIPKIVKTIIKFKEHGIDINLNKWTRRRIRRKINRKV